MYRGQQESPSKTTLPTHDPECYLCPGNKRAQGDVNPNYASTFVFVNDYSAVKEEQAPYEGANGDGANNRSRPFVPHSALIASRPRIPFPQGRARHRQVLRPHLLPGAQPHPRRYVTDRDRTRNQRLDRDLYCASVAQVPSGSECGPNPHPALYTPHQRHQAQGAIPVYADF